MSRLYADRDKYSVNVDATQGVIAQIMTRLSNLGKWIKDKYRSQAAFAQKLGVDPTRLSRWLNLSDGISDEYQAKIRKLGYSGPWPDDEEQIAPAPAGGPHATVSEVAELRGAVKAHVEQWERGQEKVLQRLEDALRRIEQLERGAK